jgi:ABC-type sugar transport system ATPase subunit
VDQNHVILECKNLCKKFGATVAVNNLSFSISQGDILGLVGENGAGKSTLIKMLGGEYAPNSGQIYFLGKAVNWKDTHEALSKGIGIVHQHPLLVESFTAEENIFLGKELVLKNKFIDNRQIHEQSGEIKKVYSIYPNLNLKQRVSEMSAGEKQVVELLKIFSYKPNILILDEPTASLPKEEAERLLNLIMELNNERNLTVIYISHKLDETFKICNRILVMRNGENVGILDKNDFDKDNLIRLMVNYDLKEFYPVKARNRGNKILEIKELCSDNFQNINLEVYAGEIVGLYGLMGAGMSDVAKTIFGMKKFSDGLIRLEGKRQEEIRCTNVKGMVDKGIYLIPEDRLRYGLVSSFSIRENVSLAHLNHYFPEMLINIGKEINLVTSELEKIHVKYSNIEQNINELSGGNQQKVIVTRWLLKECNVLIVDDPTVGIDIGAKRDIYNLLRELTENGKGVIFISSELNEIIGMADRIYTMRDGKITAELKADRINQQNVLENIL